MLLYVFIIFILFFILIFGLQQPCSVKKELVISHGKKIQDKQNKNYSVSCSTAVSFAALLILWFLTAFRADSIGNDTGNYIYYFNAIRLSGIDSAYRIEYGYQIFCYIVGIFTDNAHVFIAICATVCYLSVGIYIWKYSLNRCISTVLVFALLFSVFTNTLRQDIAMVICLYAYEALKKHRKIVCLILIVIASTFHVSALICLVWFFYKLLCVKKSYILFLCGALIFGCVTGIFESVIGFIFAQYRGYFNGQYAGTGWLAVSADCLRALCIYLFIASAYRKKTYITKIITANSAALLLLSCLGYMVNLFTRAAQYFLISAIVELPNAYYFSRIKDKKLFLITFCLCCLMYFLVAIIFRPEWNHLYPYEFFWS